MMPLRQMARLAGITRVLVAHGLDELVTEIHLLRPYRVLLLLMPWRWRGAASRPRAVRIREALEELGPIFVKFGQALSTRPDLLPDDIARELSRLQDQVPPFSGETAREVIETAYGEPLQGRFAAFSLRPAASASVAQVHYATLVDGTEVAVKVLRPGIERMVTRDVDLLYTLAKLAARYSAEARRLRPMEVVDELDHTRSRVMVMERISGIPIGNVSALVEAGIDMRKLAHNGVEIFFTQAFRDGFFHADMHPGNIFVSPDGQYMAVDFGIMGILSEVDKNYLAENFLAFFNRDYRAVAASHLRAGWVPQGTSPEAFEAAIRTVCEPIFARPIKEISFGRFLVRLFQTARRFDMEVQPQLVLLQKTLLNIEGLGRQLYPDLDLWETAKPYLEKWMRERLGPRATLEGLKREGPLWWRTLPEIPGQVHELLRKANSGELSLQWRARQLDSLRSDIRRGHRRLFYAVVGAALLVGAAVTAALDGYAPTMVFDAPAVSWLLGALGAVLLLASWPED